MYGGFSYAASEYGSKILEYNSSTVSTFSLGTFTLEYGNVFAQIVLVQNDYGGIINFILQDSSGNAFNLSGATSLVFTTQKIGTSIINSTGTVQIISATAGTCYYIVSEGDFTEAGNFNAQLHVYFSGEVVTFNNIQLEVYPVVPF